MSIRRSMGDVDVVNERKAETRISAMNALGGITWKD
jgi:hypothetical protein